MLTGTQKRIPFFGLDHQFSGSAWSDYAQNKGLTWYPLRYIHLFRIILALAFILVSLVPDLTSSLSLNQSRLFRHTSEIYILVAIISLFFTVIEKPGFVVQVTVQQLTDIFIISTLIYASGGVKSGVATLLVIIVTFGGLLLPGTMAYFFAALATISILLQQLYWTSDHIAGLTDFTSAGSLGITCFATAALAQILSSRIRTQTLLAHQAETEFNQLAQLNEHIIKSMQTGILVVDQSNRVMLVNDAAGQLLGIGEIRIGQALNKYSTKLNQTLALWRSESTAAPSDHNDDPVSEPYLPKFARIELDSQTATLIFLEDAAALQQQVQVHKMAAMGRLTGSIAHEIRNPLSAISHAAELLRESDSVSTEDTRLTQIILKHARRAKNITEDVLDLGKKRTANPDQFSLEPWLKHFVWGFIDENKLPENAIRIDALAAVEVRIDRSQLEQILLNLAKNGLEHTPADAQLKLQFIADLDRNTGRPILDVIDDGPGIAPTDREKVFEPFYSTRALGTGLGLYISRELCEANQARLDVVDNPTGGNGACFRITFMDPRRQQDL